MLCNRLGSKFEEFDALRREPRRRGGRSARPAVAGPGGRDGAGKRVAANSPGRLPERVKYPATKPPPLPPWMKKPLRFALDGGERAGAVKALVHGARLKTVCEEASCPNLGHCWQQGSATFMIMGDRCTRRCGFCDVATGRPLPLDPGEPERLARAVAELDLRHVVITSVDRDDVKDCGAEHFARCITAVRDRSPSARIEVLIPDFKARIENLERIWAAQPDIINHNVETVPSLYRSICPQSNYANSLTVLRESAARGFVAKSGLILGLGETVEEIQSVIGDLARSGARMLTIGQYLQPTREHAPLKAYVEPSVFIELKRYALSQGFQHVESGPLVRSSYHAGETFAEMSRQAQPNAQDGV